ncbi:MAG: Gfo/Idh/MocA family oxidoreductase [Armatimonadia bacterium]
MKQARIAVIGLGGRGRYFATAFDHHPRAELVAVADPIEKPLELLKHQYGDRIGYYLDYREMLKRPDIDAVVVASNDKSHRENAVAVFEAGKACLLEKPMAQSVEDCDEIIRAWKQSGKLFMIGLELRHCSLFTRMRELLDEGRIGRVIMGQALDNVSVGGQYFYHNNMRRKEYVRSLLLQKGTHTIDLLNWFMGGNPVKVYGSGGLNFYGGTEANDKRCRSCEKRCEYFINHERFVMDYGQTVETDDRCVFSSDCDVADNSMLQIEYANGTRGQYAECHFTPEYTREFTLFGTQGKMYGFYNNECNFLIRCTYRNTDHVDEWHPQSAGGGHGGGDRLIMEHFLDCLLGDDQPLADVQAARDCTAVAAAGEESIETGLPVAIPPCPWL